MVSTIRVLINEEEVVCDKDFKIKEEMLNTPSVILNNVYPKTWEMSKDYLTNFYHPQDYSKCKIEKTLLPCGYTQVEYIQSSGPQYIDTGRKSTVNTKFEMDYLSTKQSGDTFQCLFGSQNGTSNKRIYMLIGTNGNPVQTQFPITTNKALYMKPDGTFSSNLGNDYVAFSPNKKTKIIYDVPNRTLTVGEYTSVSVGTDTLQPSSNNILILARNDNTLPTSNFATGKLYRFKWYESDVLTLDLVPCFRNSDNEIGMYDVINNIFYTNSGTGTFTKGNDITNELLFCGVVKNSGNISLNPREPHYSTLQILDFKTFLSEGETLDFVIADKTIEEAIDQIISTISEYGFVKGTINILGADTVIGAYSTKDKTAYDVFNYIADITQSRWTTRLVDENTVAIDFYDPTLLPQGTAIDYTTLWFDNNLIDDMSYSYNAQYYRNKQVMTSNEVFGSVLQNQTIIADGYAKQFSTEQKIGSISSITANGIELTVATNEQKDFGYDADIYYQPGNNYFDSDDLMSTGTIIIINYVAIVEGRQIINNGTEINRIATSTGRKGVVARYENRNDATSSTELQSIGQSYIKYKGVPEILLTVKTRNNLWNVGNRVQFNAPIQELDLEYMVKSKEINYITTIDTIFYTFTLSSSFNSEQEINYFDNQRNKSRGNIAKGEYIIRNIDLETNANIIFYDNSINEATVVGDNTLNSVLNSPFTD